MTHILSSNTSDFTTAMSQPIHFDVDKKYEAALLFIDLYNSIPNITVVMNCRYK